MVADAGNPTSHSYFSQRLRLHYLDWGNEGARPLLLVHGMRDHCRTWDAVATRLRDRYHVIAPDLRGHGDSAWQIGSSYAHVDYVYDIAQLVRQAKLAPVTIIAHSMGGTLACLYAGIYPDQVSRMVIVEGVGHWWRQFMRPAPHERLAGWIDGVRALSARQVKRYGSLEEAYQRMQKTNPHLSPELALHLTAHGSHQNEDGTYSWKFDNYTHTHAPYEMPAEDTEHLWRRIECPVLFLNSAQGYPHRTGQDGTLEHFKHGKLEVIEGAGHWTHHDQPDAFMAAVEAFLAH